MKIKNPMGTSLKKNGFALCNKIEILFRFSRAHKTIFRFSIIPFYSSAREKFSIFSSRIPKTKGEPRQRFTESF
jgi:hypothetical protein